MIPLTLHNTLTRKKERFKPKNPKNVLIYTCGPTVYHYAHIGNFRTYVFEDILRRTLKYCGYGVTQVMNITDVDDKTIKRAVEQNVTLEEFVKPFQQGFFDDLKSLSIEPVEKYPAATDHIPEMIAIIEKLLEKKIAYKGHDGSIYYAIDKFPRYGCLSHLKLDELEVGASTRVATDEYDKENASDFVLWKSHDKMRDGPIFWESPFGPGRPGWHLECSAMAIKHLGEELDIHCGGVDNIFPHHENEIAQSEAFTGKHFSTLWMHSEHLIVDGKKMSKSLGNFYTLRDLLDKEFSGKQLRYLLLQTHYKTQLNFTFDGLQAAKESLHRINDFIYRMQELTQSGADESCCTLDAPLKKAKEHFENGLTDDLNVCESLAALFDLIHELHALCDAKPIGKKDAEEVLKLLKSFNSVLAIMDFHQEEIEIPAHIQQAFDEREKARKERNFSLADTLRDRIAAEGYIIEDSSKGSRLKKA